MNFKSWLINELDLQRNKIWLNPDIIYYNSGLHYGFIYADNKLYIDEGATHPDIAELIGKYNSNSRDNILRNYPNDLLGRFATNFHTNPYEDPAVSRQMGQFAVEKEENFNSVISFWNNTPSVYRNLNDCITALYEEGVIKESASEILLSTPFGTGPLSDGFQIRNKETDDAEIKKLQQKLHLMGPIEKKAMMDKLGVGAGGIKNPWQASLEKTGTINPGQKWWAPTSEVNISNKDRQSLQAILL